VKSCIIVNHYVLLVQRHLKYVWFTKFWGEVKNAPLGYTKNKKAFGLGEAPWPPDHGLCPGPRRWGLRPTAPDLRAFLQLQICHYTTGLHLFLIHTPSHVVVRRVWRGCFVLLMSFTHVCAAVLRECLNNYCTKYYTSHKYLTDRFRTRWRAQWEST